MMTCKELLGQRLQAYVDNSLAQDEEREVVHHLASCPQCSLEEKALRTLLAEIASIPAADVQMCDDGGLSVEGNGLTDFERLVFELSEAIANRQTALASSLVEQHLPAIIDLDPTTPDSALLLSCYVQWMDLGFAQVGQETRISNLDWAREILGRFSPALRRQLSMTDYAHVRLAEGLVALHDEQYVEAFGHFSHIVSVEKDLDDVDVAATASAGAARALTRQGKYRDARRYVKRAIELAEQSGRHQMKAHFGVTKAWLLFQQRRYQHAADLLDHAEGTLTDCDLALGNIESARGRLAMRRGQYLRALEHFGKAVGHYERCHPYHLNCARALINRANVERLIARCCDRVDRHRCDASPTARPQKAGVSIEARAHLAEAYRLVRAAKWIYHRQCDYRGCGAVALTLSVLAMDLGKVERAAAAAARAYEIGTANKDVILRTRARIQEARVANLLTSRLNRSNREAFNAADRARSCADEAVKLAKQTQNPHLLTKALVVKGLALFQCGAPLREIRACWRKAQRGHTPDPQDPMREEYDRLRIVGRTVSKAAVPRRAKNTENQIDMQALLCEG